MVNDKNFIKAMEHFGFEYYRRTSMVIYKDNRSPDKWIKVYNSGRFETNIENMSDTLFVFLLSCGILGLGGAKDE